jgi:hypothetical protein
MHKGRFSGTGRTTFTITCLAAALATGCVSTGGVKTSSGTPLKFVLIDTSPTGEALSVAGIYAERPPVAQNQELLIFNKALTEYAIAIADINKVKVHNNTLSGTIMYGTQETYFICPAQQPPKSSGYTACSSNWYTQFMPYEYTVSYAKGQMADFTWNELKKRSAFWRTSVDPKGAINKLNIVGLLEAQTPARK